MSDANIIVGIDLGTTNSEVAWVADGQPTILTDADDAGIMPSVVGLDAKGSLLVGRAAHNQAALAPQRTVSSVKRHMGTEQPMSLGERTYTPPEISAFILRALKARAEAKLGQPVRRAVITVPAYFTDAQRQATREAGRLADLEVVRIINEPTAAALAYGGGEQAPGTVLVYDLGGGTFDVSIVRIEAQVVEVLASTGDNKLGGDDIDRLIVDCLLDHIESKLRLTVGDDPLPRARLARAAEQAKKQLSNAPLAKIEVDHLGEVDGAPVHLVYELRREALAQLMAPLLQRTLDCVDRALTDAGLLPEQLDRVLLVGGSTRIPEVHRLLTKRLGKTPEGAIDPDLCVALGAAVQAGLEMGENVHSVLVDVTPFTFGTSALGELGGLPYPHKYVPIIMRNSKLPVRRSEMFYKLYQGQTEICINVFQGDNEDALENTKIGAFTFDGLAIDNSLGEILFTYGLDLDGILHVEAVERASNKTLRVQVDNTLGRMSLPERSAAKQRVDAAWGEGGAGEAATPASAHDDASGALPAELEAMLARARDLLGSAAPADRREMEGLMAELRAVAEGDDAERIEVVKDKLDDLMFYVE